MSALAVVQWIAVALTAVSLAIAFLVFMFETAQVSWPIRAYYQFSVALAMLRLAVREAMDRPAEWWGDLLWANLLIASLVLLRAVWQNAGQTRIPPQGADR